MKTRTSVAGILPVAIAFSVGLPRLHSQDRDATNHPPSIQSAQAAENSSEEFGRISQLAAEARAAERLSEAVTLYQKALRLRPDWDEGWWDLGTLLYSTDRHSEAREAFQHLVTRLPKHGPSWAFLGLCEMSLRNYERAVGDLDKGRTLGLGDHPLLIRVTHYNLGILLNRFERYEQAFEVLKGFARERNEEPTVIEAIGLSTLRLPFLPEEIPPDKREMVLLAGRAGFKMATVASEEADKLFLELLDRYPGAPNVHYAYGAFLTSWHYPEKGMEQFRRELETSPDHVPARLYLAHAHMQQGEYEAALPLAEQAVKLAPNAANARLALGRALLSTGELERAVEELEAGVKLEPESADLHFQLARAYRKAGRRQNAAREEAEFERLDRIRRRQPERSEAMSRESPPAETSPQR